MRVSIGKKLSDFRYFWRLRVSKGQTYFFFYTLLGMGVVAGLAPILEPEEFQHPVHDTMREIAPIWVWGGFWLVILAFNVAFIVERRYIYYLIANFLALFIALTRALTIAYGKYIQDIPITSTAMMLWVIISLNCGYALSRKTGLQSDGHKKK